MEDHLKICKTCVFKEYYLLLKRYERLAIDLVDLKKSLAELEKAVV